MSLAYQNITPHLYLSLFWIGLNNLASIRRMVSLFRVVMASLQMLSCLMLASSSIIFSSFLHFLRLSLQRGQLVLVSNHFSIHWMWQWWLQLRITICCLSSSYIVQIEHVLSPSNSSSCSCFEQMQCRHFLSFSWASLSRDVFFGEQSQHAITYLQFQEFWNRILSCYWLRVMVQSSFLRLLSCLLRTLAISSAFSALVKPAIFCRTKRLKANQAEVQNIKQCWISAYKIQTLSYNQEKSTKTGDQFKPISLQHPDNSVCFWL